MGASHRPFPLFPPVPRRWVVSLVLTVQVLSALAFMLLALGTLLFAFVSLLTPGPVGATGVTRPTVVLDGPDVAPMDAEVTYRVQVRGSGGLSPDARVEARLDPRLRFVRWDANPNGACAYLGTASTVVCRIAEDALIARMVLRTDVQDAGGPMSDLETTAYMLDQGMVHGQSTLRTALTFPDLSVGFAAPEVAPVGVPFRYGMRVQNTGTGGAPDTSMATVLPRGVQFSGWIANPNGACAYFADTHSVACDLGTLEPKAAPVWVRFAVVATPQTARTRLVGSTQVATTRRGDPSPRNNSATAQTWIGDHPSLESR